MNLLIKNAGVLLLLLGFSSFALAESTYLLKEGDEIEISVWGEDKLDKNVRVLPDGSVSFPLAGNMKIAGLSAPQVEAKIAEKLKAYISDPVVSVVFRSTEGNRIFVLGKVPRPGPIAMTAPLTLTQALSVAGGLDKFAEEDQIIILRNAGGKPTQLKVKYSDILTGKDLSTNYDLKAGDTILVP